MRRNILGFASATFTVALLLPGFALAAGDSASGERLFTEKKCHLCHNLTEKRKVGPGLKGDTKRHSEEWLTKWLSDPQKTWEENDTETQQLKQWAAGRDSDRKTRMKIKKLTEQEIADLIAFLKKNDEE
ncbi:MAG: c-type cytochrome [Nitrospinota bacterium]|nr:c-type cytochrome [Nitrospinota bacterium]